MLVVAMILAACYGVFQLAALGWPARTVGIGTLLLAVGVGMYGCGVLAVLAELAYTRGVAAATGDPLFQVVQTAGYTVDPFIEEAAKVIPLLVVGLCLRARLHWGLTDYLLVGAAAGAGFGLLEAVLRFGHRAGRAIEAVGGWLLPTSLSPPYFPGPGATLTSWLPAPVSAEVLGLPDGPGINMHLAYSALAGLGIGFALRSRGRIRLLGIVPLLLVGADHASYNFDLNLTAGSAFGRAVTAPFVAAQPLLGLWPLLALVLAVRLDLGWLHRGMAANPELALARERCGHWISGSGATGRRRQGRIDWWRGSLGQNCSGRWVDGEA